MSMTIDLTQLELIIVFFEENIWSSNNSSNNSNNPNHREDDTWGFTPSHIHGQLWQKKDGDKPTNLYCAQPPPKGDLRIEPQNPKP